MTALVLEVPEEGPHERVVDVEQLELRVVVRELLVEGPAEDARHAPEEQARGA